MTGILLDYKGCLADCAGSKGLDSGQMDILAEKVSTVVHKVNRARNDGETSYRDLPYNQLRYDRTVSLAEKIRSEYDHAVFIGSADWSAGVKMLRGERLGSDIPKTTVIEGYSPEKISALIQQLDDKASRTFFIVAGDSRKNAYKEPQLRSMFKLFKKIPNFLAITDASDSLFAQLCSSGGLDTLFVPAGINGQLPLLSEAGLLYAAVCGIDIEQMLSGARAVDYMVSREDFYKNPAAVNSALYWHYADNGFNSYSTYAGIEELVPLSAWYALNCLDTLVGLPEANLEGLKTCICLKDDKIKDEPNVIRLNLDGLSPYVLGEFIYYTEVTTLISERLFKGDYEDDDNYNHWLNS